MDIEVPLRELGEIDASALRDAIFAQDETAWREDEYRQDVYDVHRQNRSRPVTRKSHGSFSSNDRALPSYWRGRGIQ